MTDFAKLIEIKRVGGYGSLKIDGEGLPWLISDEINIPAKRGEMPGAWIKVYAEEIRVENSLGGSAEEQGRCGVCRLDLSRAAVLPQA